MPLEQGKCPYGHCLSCGLTGQAFLFLLTVSLIEKGQKRNNQTSKGNQQPDYPYEYQNNIRSRHITHLPSYVLLASQGYWLGRQPPCHGYSPNGFRHIYNHIINSTKFQSALFGFITFCTAIKTWLLMRLIYLYLPLNQISKFSVS